MDLIPTATMLIKPKKMPINNQCKYELSSRRNGVVSTGTVPVVVGQTAAEAGSQRSLAWAFR